ncbi:MAG: T9SS type A sorting domain-containing protein [Crocinitomicaceae bacterium]|nr:T9SS type A sorting domain-containing protein [Crocinitomicaceae bacterium]
MKSNYLKTGVFVLLFILHYSARSQTVNRYSVSSFQISGLNDSILFCGGQPSAGFDNSTESFIGYLPLDYSLLAIQEYENIFRIFPVPASEKIYVVFNSNIFKGSELLIHDVSGRIVKSFQLLGLNYNYYEFDISDISEGSYLVSVITDGSMTGSKQIIIY